jgi:hypothetical protein
MPPYLSPAWVQAFNAAVSVLDLTDAIAAAGSGSLTASSGSFAVAQVVTDGPPEAGGGSDPLRTVLTVSDGHLEFQLDPGGDLPSNVTIMVNYEDAIAMARGELEPADALAAGRVRVRGELAVLVAGQVVLNAASVQLGSALADLTD